MTPKRSPSVDFLDDSEAVLPAKAGQLLVKEEGSWTQKKFHFDPSNGTLTVGEIVFTLDVSRTEIKPSPFRLVHVPDSLVMHLSPVDIHFTSADRATLMDWVYYFRSWLRRQPLLVPPLTSSEAESARSLLASPPDLLLVDKFGIRVTSKTLACLRKGEWLSDEVVNFYLSLLDVFSWSTFFWSKLVDSEGIYDYSRVRNWGSKRNFSIHVPLMLVPMHIEKAHWALGVVDLHKHTSMYLDSLGPQIEHELFHEYMQRYLEDELKFSKKLIRLPAPVNLACQQNGSDCGVFLCLFALAISKGKDPACVTPAEVPSMRKRIAVQIGKS